MRPPGSEESPEPAKDEEEGPEPVKDEEEEEEEEVEEGPQPVGDGEAAAPAPDGASPAACAAAGPGPDVPKAAAGDDEGPGGSKYLLGALALLALGLLLVPGGIYDPAEGPAESDVPRDVAGGQQEPPVPAGVTEPPPPEAGSPPSLQSMSLLLDRLAKENQDIRLMQAELQAHKEELQALLRRSEDEAAAAGAQRRGSPRLGGLERRLEQAEAAEPWKKPFKADNKEGKRHKRHEGAEKREQGLAHGPGKEPRPPREHKAGPEAPAQPGPAEPPLLSRYRAPRGCSGVAKCARKEGMEPVQRAQFLQLLQGFLERQGWGRHLAGVTARLDGAFGPDGTFAHDRLRFVDFVDDAEELLEELARREGGDEEAADGFEEFVLQRVARGFAKKERPRKGPQQHRGGGPAWSHESRSRG
ncbi:pre-B-cell leukemia transcription factor-interacting protein 1 [Nothoprocta perdicaria]|uniref:pre-B-cell leukemia transcription factor-interacting protein 1 n=1 Tax=Nothoprocta perdicaria TaxID=30464 RepID=UPI000E1B8D85|nr:pre-B-cell leukemia transcription factor-interacting protein 1 [Nothoprocta perdicaria]